MDRTTFAKALIETGAVQFGSFTLASGKTSDWYCDLKRALTRPDLLRHVAREMAPHARGHARIAGVELGAVPIAAAVALESGVPYLMVRKAAKEHGTKRGYEGELIAGDRVLFVEDVVTTAGTLTRSIETLRRDGAVIEETVAVVDREEGGREVLQALGVRLSAILTVGDVRRANTGGDTLK